MPQHSEYLASLSPEERNALEQRLLARGSGRCFICDRVVDLLLHKGQLDIDHIEPLAQGGIDEENNLALVHASCNRSKGASDLRVARRMDEFDDLQLQAEAQGERGANLGHVLRRYDGSHALLRLKREGDSVAFSLGEVGDATIYRVPLHKDPLNGMEYFFSVFPLQYLHHDNRINPRSIGTNVRALIEEFLKKRPQLHVALAWWAPEEDGAGRVKVFDGQHKAAAQILLGVRALPVRVFLEPDANLLLQANTNAGDKLRQVAFDAAVMRHLGSTLYAERVKQYQQMKGLQDDYYSFSEKELVSFFKGEHREMQRYIVDAQRDAINYHKENKLREFVEWSGKSADRPISYTTIERTFLAAFLGKSALDTSIDYGMETGENPRLLERENIVQVMNLFADTFLIHQWDPEIGGWKLETRLQKGDPIPEGHLRAWRVSREEILANILLYVQGVIKNYFAWSGEIVDEERIMQIRLSEVLWKRLALFLKRVAALPCWIDRNLSLTVFGAKQNREFWKTVFKSGKTPTGVQVLAKPLDIMEMIQESERAMV